MEKIIGGLLSFFGAIVFMVIVLSFADGDSVFKIWWNHMNPSKVRGNQVIDNSVKPLNFVTPVEISFSQIRALGSGEFSFTITSDEPLFVYAKGLQPMTFTPEQGFLNPNGRYVGLDGRQFTVVHMFNAQKKVKFRISRTK